MRKFTFSFENGTFEIIKPKNSYSWLTQSSPPPVCCLWPSCLSSCLPTSWFVFLHTWGIVPKEATVNCFQRQEARVNVLSLKLWRVPYHIAERERTMGTQWKFSPSWEGLLEWRGMWPGNSCILQGRQEWLEGKSVPPQIPSLVYYRGILFFFPANLAVDFRNREEES